MFELQRHGQSQIEINKQRQSGRKSLSNAYAISSCFTSAEDVAMKIACCLSTHTVNLSTFNACTLYHLVNPLSLSNNLCESELEKLSYYLFLYQGNHFCTTEYEELLYSDFLLFFTPHLKSIDTDR